MAIADLAAVNAILNGISAVLLVIGYVLIRQGKRDQHRAVMIAAFAASVLFLISYLVYHWHIGSRPYTGQGTIRAVYFFILITHIVLAAFTPFLAIITLWRGLGGRFAAHRKIARWTLPIWLYVSITGVAVYLMLYVY
jgi:uncharacterized membrane protein YozB (DUF420 family)